jgi:Fe2+ transport system protein FeoA
MPGEKGRIAQVQGRRSIKRRILDMGLVPGSEIEMERYAPLGDPVEIKLKGYHLSLRKEEAENIILD